MLTLRKLATVVLVGLVIFAWSLPVKDVHSLSTMPVSSGLILDGGFDVVPDGAGNFYILSYSNASDNCNLTYCDNSGDTPALSTVSVKTGTPPTKGYISILSNSPYVYLFYHTEIVQLQVSSRGAAANPYLKDINLVSQNISQGLAVGANNEVFMCASNATLVGVYDSNNKEPNAKLEEITGPIAAITTDTSNNYLYTATNDKLYRYKISDGTYTFESTAIDGNFAPFKFLTDNIFITSAGKICALNSSEFKLDFNVDMKATMENYPACVAIAGFDNDSILAKTAEKVVSRIRCSDGAVTGKIEFGEKILDVATSGDKTIVVTGTTTATNIHLITASDITDITPLESEKPPETGGGTNPDVPNPDTPAETPEDTSIESTEGYEIRNDVISKIPAGTTWGTLRNGLEANYVTVELNGKSNATTSTKVATGHKITFIFDNERKVTKTFTLIVEGDVTGSGNISSKSISALANHLLGKTELEGVYKDAANLSGDGDLSAVDLLLMYKQTQK